MSREKNTFIIEDYQRKAPFSSFLPGIAGPMGIPAWVYYNNRGQGVCSFGARDRDHAILEFCPAHMAYQNNGRTGFRTFLKTEGRYTEALKGRCSMRIAPSELEVSGQTEGLAVTALYFGIPGERAAMLARVLTLKNTKSLPLEVEVFDGLPALVPYGINNERLKTMTQLSKAWMQVEQVQTGKPRFCVRASMDDTAQVTKVQGCNFACAINEQGHLLMPVVQPALLFGEDTSLEQPDGYLSSTMEELCSRKQVTENEFPCCFFPEHRTLQPGESLQLFSLYGQTDDKDRVEALTAAAGRPDWFLEKQKEAAELVEELTAAVSTRTADPVFDNYCRQNCLDNLLRGGTPVFFGEGKHRMPFYLYSRKHGDPEREYNAFSLGNEYYAQGNGNFRDVCQNRRCDVFFHPGLQAFGIRYFFELIQSDGYNPLVLTYSTFRMEEEAARLVLRQLPEKKQGEALTLLTGEFTPGQLSMFAEDCGLNRAETEQFLGHCLGQAVCDPNADFSEGYWSDHWTYLQDLVDQYLSIYPEQKQELLFGDRDLRWYAARTFVNPRRKRYEQTKNGLRQYHALDMTRIKAGEKWMQTASGETARSSLAEKMTVLCTLKAATVDAAGMGIEMEGGKPGWYDALNGLPGLLGSSMAETCELVRTLHFLAQALEEQKGTMLLYEEMGQLLISVTEAYRFARTPYERWDLANTAKETYREQTLNGPLGACMEFSCSQAAQSLRLFESVLREGIEQAAGIGNGICPTYFSYEAGQTKENRQGLMPESLTPHLLPLFLEGPVHWMKLGQSRSEKEAVARKIQESGLYDRKLQMYKVNESLKDVTFEAGRALAFTPGWLENESIWLHMEYKYLLELLRSGLYEQFGEAFRRAAVPFLNPEVYGRSTFENVSFIASSANPNPAVHGRGFVARLSGSTAEFTEIWKLMFFGGELFSCADQDKAEGRQILRLRLQPYLPDWLIPESGEVSAVFMGSAEVTYHRNFSGSILPGQYRIDSWTLTGHDGKDVICREEFLTGSLAKQVRDGKFARIRVELVQ